MFQSKTFQVQKGQDHGILKNKRWETDEEMDNQQFDYKKNNIEELLNETGSHESGQIQYN